MRRHKRSSRFHPIIRDERGATAVEYGLILGLIVIVALAGLSEMAGSVVGMWGDIATKVSGA